jgi:hypothetical protein
MGDAPESSGRPRLNLKPRDEAAARKAEMERQAALGAKVRRGSREPAAAAPASRAGR